MAEEFNETYYDNIATSVFLNQNILKIGELSKDIEISNDAKAILGEILMFSSTLKLKSTMINIETDFTKDVFRKCVDDDSIIVIRALLYIKHKGYFNKRAF